MLITFYSDAYENIMMFGDVAKALLKKMGHSGTVPGAILAKDIPEALSNLQASLAKEKPVNSVKNHDENDEVSLSLRAVPLINMLKSAAKNDCNIMWK